MMNKRVIGKILAALTAGLAGTNALAGMCSLASATAGGLYDNTVNAFHGATASWLTNANGIASHLFWGLAGIEFVWAAIHWTLRKNEIGDLLASVFFKVMSIGFFYWLAIVYAPTWVPMILQGFQQMAAGVLGSTAAAPPTVQPGMISPSAVMSVGLCIAENLTAPMTKMGVTGALELLKNPFFALLIVAAIVVVVISYFVITLQLLLAEIEACIALFGGAVMLGFTGSRWTLPWGEKYFAYAVSIGVKLMVIFLVIGVGDQIVTNQINSILTGDRTLQVRDFVVLMLTILVYAGLAWNVPAMAGSFLNGSPHMSMGTMAGAAMASGAALVGLAAGGASVAAAGAAGVKAAGAAAGAGARALQSGASGASGAASGGSAAGTASAGYQRLASLGQKIMGTGGGSGGSSGGNAGDAAGSPGAASGGGSTARASGGSSSGSGAAGTGSGTSPDAGAGSASAASGDSSGAASPQQPQEVRPSGTENAIAGAQAGGPPTAEDMNKLTGAVERLAAGQKPAPYRQRAGEYAKAKLSSAAQHLRSSDGQTGSVSIRFNHHHD
jgi:type IV secretion system protein TrbL